MLTLGRAPTFRFLDPGPLVDGELELVAPHASLAEEFVRTCAHPMSRAESGSLVDRRQLHEFLRAAPRGRQDGDPSRGRAPSYHFWMRLRPQVDHDRFSEPAAVQPRLPPPRDVTIAGTIGLRVGQSRDLEMYLGQIGY